MGEWVKCGRSGLTGVRVLRAESIRSATDVAGSGKAQSITLALEILSENTNK